MNEQRTDLAKPEHREKAVNRAKEMLERAKPVNAAQHAHGINSTSASVRWFLKKIENGEAVTYKFLTRMHDDVMKLGGYLYSLKEGLE